MTVVDEQKPPLLVLIGPTAVGKTKLSIELAKRYNAEIISGDSMQVYKGMDIGTAKITTSEMEGIPHHLIDVCTPEQAYSVAQFQTQASQLIEDITARGKLPMIVGGTGLYIESLVFGYQFPESQSDEAFRNAMQQLADTEGVEVLFAKLQQVDPVSSSKLHANDVRRVIRALEVFHLTGVPASQQATKQTQSPYNHCIIGLTMDRAKLYERINARVDLMMSQGLVDEVRRLISSGTPMSAVALQGIGYKEIVAFLQGQHSLEAATELLKRDTRRFAKRQLSWFRHMDSISWVEAEQIMSQHLEQIHAILTGKFSLLSE